MSSAPIDFWYDYSSPYGYLASERIEAVAAARDRQVRWRPFLLGAVFKLTGGAPLTETPMKGDYSQHDFRRSAREHDIAFEFPSTFPVNSVAASRATLWCRDHADSAISEHTAALVHALYRAYYADGRNIGEIDVVLDVAHAIGLPQGLLRDALGDAALKEALKSEVTLAIERQVFGSPMVDVDGEKFWGHDRLEQVDRWLARGGW